MPFPVRAAAFKQDITTDRDRESAACASLAEKVPASYQEVDRERLRSLLEQILALKGQVRLLNPYRAFEISLAERHYFAPEIEKIRS